MKKIFVNILNWNNWGDTIECLNSVYNINIPLSIAIIDNGSTDDSIKRIQEWIKKHKKRKTGFKKRIFFIKSKKNLGFSAGNNLGLRFSMKSRSDYIMILNNDTIIEPAVISELIDVLEQNPKYGVAGPSIYFYNDRKRPQFKKYLGIKEIKEDVGLSGCCFLIKKEVIKKIGPFDEDFFLFNEERDFMLRAKKAGFKVLYVPTKGAVFHKFSATVSKYSKVLHYNMAKSAILFLKKHPGEAISVFIGLSIHLTKILRKEPSKIKFFVSGIIDGFKN
jgi:GT2 family glycosyltransferase